MSKKGICVHRSVFIFIFCSHFSQTASCFPLQLENKISRSMFASLTGRWHRDFYLFWFFFIFIFIVLSLSSFHFTGTGGSPLFEIRVVLRQYTFYFLRNTLKVFHFRHILLFTYYRIMREE